MKILFILIMILFFIPTAQSHAIVNSKEEYSYEDLTNDIKEICQVYNDETMLQTIGYSHFGKNIWAVKLGHGKTNIMFLGAHHGREWLTTTLLMKMLEEYAQAYRQKQDYGPFTPQIFDEVAIWFVPMVNPDGVTIQQKGLKMVSPELQNNLFFMNALSPDFTKWKANGLGIDLNRQYPAGWDELTGGPSIPWYQFYKGENPLETSEVKAITRFTDRIKPEIALSYHSSGREIFWRFKNGFDMKRDQQIAGKVSLLTGYSLSIPQKNAIGGGFTDWFITTHHKPGMTVEISYPVGERSPPLSIFAEEWKRNELVGIMLATEAAKMILEEKQ